MMIKTLLIKILGRLGYEIIASSRNAPINMSQHLQSLFEKFGIDCVLDVGANIGQYADFLRNQIGYNGLIISFEPINEHISLLNEKSENDPKWHVYGFALGAENTEKPINVMRASALSSFLEPDHSNTNLFSLYNRIHHRQTVNMKTLDSIIDKLKAKHQVKKIFLKLDTQGYDFQVILGAERTLAVVLAIQIELSVQSIYSGMPTYYDVLKEMHKRGYDLSGMFSNSQDSLLRLIEFDCILINRCVAEGADIRAMRVPGLVSGPLLSD